MGRRGASQGVLVIVWLIKAAEVGVTRIMMSSQARYRKPLYKREFVRANNAHSTCSVS